MDRAIDRQVGVEPACPSATPSSWRGESQRILGDVEAEDGFQVVDHHRAWHDVAVGQEPLDVVTQDTGLARASRRGGGDLVAAGGDELGEVLDQLEDRECLQVEVRLAVVPVRVRVPTPKVEIRSSGRSSWPRCSPEGEHGVQGVGDVVVPAVLRHPDLVGVEVKRPEGGDGLRHPAPIHDVEDVALQPRLHDGGLLRESGYSGHPGEHLGVVLDLLDADFRSPARGRSRPVAA